MKMILPNKIRQMAKSKGLLDNVPQPEQIGTCNPIRVPGFTDCWDCSFGNLGWKWCPGKGVTGWGWQK